MNSCCRTAALRIFVRNISQIHFPPPTSAYRIPRYHSTLTRLSTLQRTIALGSTRDRLLHTSCPEGREEGAWPPPEGLPAHQEPSPPKIVFETTHDAPFEPTKVTIDAQTPTQNESASPQDSGEVQPKPLGKWARKKLKKAQQAAAMKPEGGEEASAVADAEHDTTMVVGEENDEAPSSELPAKDQDEVPSSDRPVQDQTTVEREPDTQPAEKEDKPKSKRPKRDRPEKCAPKKEPKKYKFKKLKKEREERRRKKLEMMESGEVTMGKVELQKALKEKKEREERERTNPMALKLEAARAERLTRKAELKLARKERRRQEFEEAKRKAEAEADSAGKEEWQIQKEALQAKFPEGWMPRKKLSPDALAGIRALHKQFPEQYNTATLAKKFEVSPEAIRRILKSKWTPDAEEEEERQGRWFNRGKRVWAQWAELGKKPPAKWRAEGVVRDPKWNRGRKKMGGFLG
ncbi:Required for respiratory growth protein 9 mitochondrial [Podospora bellae-mahoneyi]|uniref:Required for respiratory growth protein 9, mitochondrial n=1 Tax=Podospora bellae-mahoneyi TaxID=2093777 RepID=A0ABR0FPY0_9PEZI|nr:Required for respiratory growth protein 9 mitochondrial [Podospora bellae-mahoneyi]